MDQNVGLLIDSLAAEGLLDNTVIVIASDHGEAFFEHGGEGHARNLYWEVQNVPLIIAPPLDIEGGVVVEEPVANIDIWPTLLDLLGLPGLDNVEGRSLLPLVLAAGGAGSPPADLQRRALFAQLDRSWGNNDNDPDEIISMRREPYRFIYSRERPENSELYDHTSDPGEQENLGRSKRELAESMGQEVRDFFSRSERPWEVPEVEMDDMMRAQLRALGYVVTPGDSAKAAGRRRKAAAKETP